MTLKAKASLLSPEKDIDTSIYSESETFLKSALDAMSAHIAILDESGVILDVNAAWRDFARVNNFTHNAYGIGLNYLTVCDNAAPVSKDAFTVGEGIRSVMGHELNEFYLEYPCHSPSERRWYVVRVTRFDWYGHVRLIVAHQNVTELKQVQIQLEESKTRIQAILDNVVDGIMTIDDCGVIETVNPAAAQIFGYSMQELSGVEVKALFPKKRILKDLLVDTHGMGHETIGQRKDGSRFPMYIALSQMRMGSRTLYTGMVQDITIRKRLEAEVLDKERLGVALDKERELRLLKDRFISVMSHELRTPLASIQLASDMLRKYGDRSTEEEKQEALETIEMQVKQLSELVKDVLTISKTEFLAQDLQLEVYDLETYLRDILEELSRTYSRTHRLAFAGLNRRVEVRLDRKLLRHAFVNLLSNAIKYSPEGSEICLKLHLDRDAHEAVVEVIDQGIGIPEEDLPRMFDAFHRAGNVEQYQGTGLGLAIAKQAVELHGGKISVTSRLNVGTTFTVRLPLL